MLACKCVEQGRLQGRRTPPRSRLTCGVAKNADFAFYHRNPIITSTKYPLLFVSDVCHFPGSHQPNYNTPLPLNPRRLSTGDHAYKTSSELPADEQMISASPDVRCVTIEPGTDEFMVLACDGIWNSKRSQEVVDFVSERIRERGETKLSNICEEVS